MHLSPSSFHYSCVLRAWPRGDGHARCLRHQVPGHEAAWALLLNTLERNPLRSSWSKCFSTTFLWRYIVAKQLSDQISDLSARAKNLETAVTAARKEGHDKLVSLTAQARASATAAVDKVKQ